SYAILGVDIDIPAVFSQDTLIDRLVLTGVKADCHSAAGCQQINVSAIVGLDFAGGQRDVAIPFVSRKECGDRGIRSIKVIKAGTGRIIMIAPGIAEDEIENVERDLFLLFKW